MIVIEAQMVPASNLFVILAFIGKSNWNMINGILACLIGMVSAALIVYFFGFDKNEPDLQSDEQ